jgi:hypothetical protein
MPLHSAVLAACTACARVITSADSSTDECCPVNLTAFDTRLITTCCLLYSIYRNTAHRIRNKIHTVCTQTAVSVLYSVFSVERKLLTLDQSLPVIHIACTVAEYKQYAKYTHHTIFHEFRCMLCE